MKDDCRKRRGSNLLDNNISYTEPRGETGFSCVFDQLTLFIDLRQTLTV